VRLNFSLPAQSANVSTWQDDKGRTGQNTNETTLTTSNVNKKLSFGKICFYTLQTNEEVYAQPLVLAACMASLENTCSQSLDWNGDCVGARITLWPRASRRFTSRRVVRRRLRLSK
jgi:hypothetical protein